MNKKKLVIFILLSLLGGFFVVFIDSYISNQKSEIISVVGGGVYTSADTFTFDMAIFLITAGYILVMIFSFYKLFLKKEKKKEEGTFKEFGLFEKNE